LVLDSLRRALVGTGSGVLTLVGAILIGFGIPLFWIYVASSLYGKPGAVTGPVAVFIGTGILVSYWGLLLLASWVRGKMLQSDQARATRKEATVWNRSMRDSRDRVSDTDPVERLFVVTAIVSIIGFAVWFALFAGAPVPTN
jgi:multisubunit Na+/H+ antiporter MnhC subunit